MIGPKHAHWAVTALAVTAVLATLAWGTFLRVEDPRSSPVMAAEDPYTHMALVREHLRDGDVEPLNPQGTLYPPGMHAYIAAVWSFTGLELYDIMRFGPAFFGAIGMLGVALLLGRSDGLIAAAVGALTFAVAPEAIMRTSLMTPTAVDLALVPFLFLAVLEVLQGRLAWSGPAGALALYLVFAHPWVLTVIGLAGVLFLLGAVALPWPATRGKNLTALGVAVAVAVIGVAWGLSLSGCAGYCGQGFGVVYKGGEQLNVFGPFIAVAALVAAALIALGARPIDRLLQRPAREPAPTPARITLCIALVVAFVLVTAPAWLSGWPPQVSPVSMFGWPLIVLGVVGFVCLPLLPSPAAHVGAAIAVSTYPFVIYDPFHSPFWSHRTAVYLALGLFLLAGSVAGAMARSGIEAMQARGAEAAAPTTRRRVRPMHIAVPAMLVLVFVGGTVVAVTPDYDEDYQWYRLFTWCEFDVLQRTADRVSADPHAYVITGDWQSKLVLAALTENAERVWYKGDFFTSTADHRGLMQLGPLYVVEDPYLANGTPGADTSYFHQAPWTEAARSCPDEANDSDVVVYTTRGGRL